MPKYIDKCKNFVDPFLLDEMKNRNLIFAGERYADVEKRLEAAYSYIEKTEHDYLADKLYDRVRLEHEKYIDEIKKLPPDKIIDEAYKLTILYDIQCSLDPYASDITTERLRALMLLESPLWYLYNEWQRRDYSHMDNVRAVIELSADERAAENEDKSYEIGPDPFDLDEEADGGQEP